MIVYLILISASGIAFLLFIGAKFLKIQKIRRKYSQKYTVLSLKIPKENEIGPISAEHIFSTLHGIQNNFSFFDRLRGYSADTVSFEIASINRMIKFYVAFPEKLRNLIEGQIYAQYPDVEIIEVADYAKNPGNKQNAMGLELCLSAPDVFPIKRYSQFVDNSSELFFDPLAGITSSLVKFSDPEDQAWIQIAVNPISSKLRNRYVNILKSIKKTGLCKWQFLVDLYCRIICTKKIWPKLLFFPVYFIFWLIGLAIGQNEIPVKEDINESVSLKHDKEDKIQAASDKISRLLFNANIRVVYIPKNNKTEVAKIKLREIAASFKQFNYSHLNGFEFKHFVKNPLIKYKYRIAFDGMILNNEELATIFHLPNNSVKTPTIHWVSSKKLEPPMDLPLENSSVTTLGKTNFRDNEKIFGIKPDDRRRHIYVVGKTGMGKSTLLENMISSDIANGSGVGMIDPHGDLAESVMRSIPSNRINDVVLIDPADKEYAVAFNMLENVDEAFNSIVCSGLVGIFKKIYSESWGPRLEHILRNTILALLEYQGATMLGITRILQDAKFRRLVLRQVKDPVVRSFWLNEFEKMNDKLRIDAISPILNKVGQFLSSNTIRNIVGQPKSSIDFRFFMDKGKIVIINLSKGRIGEDNSALLGSMFITKFQLDAMSRANISQEQRKDFYLYVDEFQNFATEAFATILSEARKYRLNLTMANQYIAQMPDEVRDAVFGNVGSLLSFQVGADDADYISQQFGEEILPSDLVSLSKFTAYSRLLIDGMPSKTFSLKTLPPVFDGFDAERAEKILRVSRERYSKKVSVVSDKIRRWSMTKDEKQGINSKDKNI
ncbi:type IV secretion system DNA-binding domain-containing protein [Candidatus Peregrinibacteria bacterium]|nr:type IV secretion system DNA-binding domain-containing protein [Candidatus Peregrinibacteria bacterium]